MIRNDNVRKLIKTSILTTGFCLLMMGINTGEGFAHGYITTSRAALAKYGVNVNAGNVQYEPQSVEAKGGFPYQGPEDGQIASAGIFLELDEQSEDRWVKVPMSTGSNTFEWNITAPHRTSEFKYYITKNDWDPNKAITRNDIEEIAKIDGNNEIPEKTVNHTINIPSDKQGYHVILGVWEIADTGNAFYQVIDVDLNNDNVEEDKQAPTVPSNLKSTNQTSSSIELAWDKSTDNVGVHHYDIYRDNVKIDSTKELKYIDTDLKSNTEYTYIVKAVDNAGNESIASNSITVKTQEIGSVDTEAPTAPKNLHSMGVTESSINLHWNKSTDNVGVNFYNIYRDGRFIASTTDNKYTDMNLKSDREYKYTVEAVDEAGNKSEISNTLVAKTSKLEEPEVSETTWKQEETYLAGDIVIYNGIEYKAKWWTSGDVPGKSDVWEIQTKDIVLEWIEDKAYIGGDRVIYNGNTYEAKWWVREEKPNNSSAWQIIK